MHRDRLSISDITQLDSVLTSQLLCVPWVRGGLGGWESSSTMSTFTFLPQIVVYFGSFMTLSGILVWQDRKKMCLAVMYFCMSNNKSKVAMVYKLNSTYPLDTGVGLLLLVSYYLIHRWQAWNCYPFLFFFVQFWIL